MSARISSVIPFAAACESNAIHCSQEFGDVEFANAVVFFRRDDHGDVAVLASDANWLALGRIDDGGEALLGVGWLKLPSFVHYRQYRRFRQSNVPSALLLGPKKSSAQRGLEVPTRSRAYTILVLHCFRVH